MPNKDDELWREGQGLNFRIANSNARVPDDKCYYYQPEEVFPRVLKKHTPKERIPLVLLQQLALGISLKMIKASSREEVVKLHGEAIQEAKDKALEEGVVHLIDWTTFLLV